MSILYQLTIKTIPYRRSYGPEWFAITKLRLSSQKTMHCVNLDPEFLFSLLTSFCFSFKSNPFPSDFPLHLVLSSWVLRFFVCFLKFIDVLNRYFEFLSGSSSPSAYFGVGCKRIINVWRFHAASFFKVSCIPVLDTHICWNWYFCVFIWKPFGEAAVSWCYLQSQWIVVKCWIYFQTELLAFSKSLHMKH